MSSKIWGELFNATISPWLDASPQVLASISRLIVILLRAQVVVYVGDSGPELVSSD